LFGSIDGSATIRNVHITAWRINGITTGGLIGQIDLRAGGTVTVENCSVSLVHNAGAFGMFGIYGISNSGGLIGTITNGYFGTPGTIF